MNDRTEHVEEALGWLIEEARRPQGKAPRPPVVVRRRAGVIRDAIRDLRSRLEEAEHQAHVERHRAEHRAMLIASCSRRADRLEEAVREAYLALGGDDAYNRIESILSGALDSREDEGEGRTWHESGCPALGGDECECRDASWGAPVHADEPEEDDGSVFCKCGHPTYCHVATEISDDGYRHGECLACDECSEFRPTDEPVNREGVSARQVIDGLLDWALSNRGTEHEFVTCYTYDSGDIPEPIQRAKRFLSEHPTHADARSRVDPTAVRVDIGERVGPQALEDAGRSLIQQAEERRE